MHFCTSHRLSLGMTLQFLKRDSLTIFYTHTFTHNYYLNLECLPQTSCSEHVASCFKATWRNSRTFRSRSLGESMYVTGIWVFRGLLFLVSLRFSFSSPWHTMMQSDFLLWKKNLSIKIDWSLKEWGRIDCSYFKCQVFCQGYTKATNTIVKQVSVCISYISVTVIRYHDRKQLIDEIILT